MVPKGWSLSLLGDISCNVTSGSRDWAQYYSEFGSKFIRMTNLSRDGIHLLLDDLKYVNVLSDSSDGKRTALQAGDILISITAELGKIGWVPEGFGEAYINQHTALVRINKKFADDKFIAYLLSSARMNKTINSLNDAGAKAGLNLPTIKSLQIYLPPIYEQKKIAQILSTWDQAIATTERLLDLARQQKKALMQQLLTGKKRFPGFEGEWKYVQFGKVFKERVETERDDLPLLSITAEDGVVYQDETGRKDTSNEDKSKYRRICVDDIGYNTMRMWQGRSSLSDKEGIVSPAYTIVTPSSGIYPRFAAYLFKLPELVHVFYRHSQGLVSDTWNLKFSRFAKIKWAIPSLNEQKKIAAVLLSSDQEIETLQSQLDGLKQEKKALMQQLLSGRRRLKFEESANGI